MHIVDFLIGGAVVLILMLLGAVLARQRYMLRVAGGVPLAVRVRGNRWVYGIARYSGGELRWYRGIGLGTRPTRVLHRRELSIVTHRAPGAAELASLPAAAIIVECRDGEGTATFGFSESAFTWFVSWLEASAPMS
ncbi:MAG: hypothetical protein DLM58_14110 [Pseudonocardiales bacterium]|nr:MAG: hypothetical protein DLM54_09290 [Acidimicrobiales bacterium]PZS30185.1 MAG: hypothetical protein DLM58_14110 [Pseudonocardiales bacterium]